MRSKSKLFFDFIKTNKIWLIIIGLVILGVVYSFFWGGDRVTTPSYVLAERSSIKEIVSATGNVKPLTDVDLAFERGGRVEKINVAVGDKVYIGESLLSVANADLIASLDQANANYKKALAQYQDIKIGTRPEEITLQESQVEKAVADLFQAKISLINSIKDSFTKADDAIRNKMYSLFDNAIKYNARLSFTTDSFLAEDIEDGRNIVSDLLDVWYKSLSYINSTSEIELYYNEAKENLSQIKKLLDKCAEAVNGLNSDSSDLEQTQIDTWKANISLARTNIDSAITSLTTNYDVYTRAISALKISQDQLAIKTAGSTAGSILSAEASFEVAKAGIASAAAELAKSIIKSPINGTITNIDAKVGEIIPASKVVISIISYGDYEVETYVSEADISKISMGNKASTTLDAYGSGVNFDTTVIKIDPAATVIDGVPTYKVTLKFDIQDERIRSGMTANLEILTAEKNNVLVVPSRAVYSRNGGLKYTEIIDKNGIVQEVQVKVGIRGIDGVVEIISGINQGDKVITSL